MGKWRLISKSFVNQNFVWLARVAAGQFNADMPIIEAMALMLMFLVT